MQYMFSTALASYTGPSTSQKASSANIRSISCAPGLAVQDHHHDLGNTRIQEAAEPISKEASLADFPSSTPNNVQLMTMSQSEKPVATAEKYAHELNDPLPYSPLRRRRAQSLSSGLPLSGLVAARVNTINKVNLLTGNVNSADSDRNTLPSQQQPSLPIASPL
jgi:hypothetical protein